MTEHDKARRSFLINSAIGVGAVAGSALPADAMAKNGDHGSANHPTATTENRGAFLSEDEAATVSAFAERLMPGAPGKPGAKDANVVNYIDLALSGAYADQQEFYRHGLAQLDAYCNASFKEAFVYLKPAQQDDAIRALEGGKATGFSWPTAQAFFNTLRTHTMEGMFADPIYGGNRDFAGWKLVGFPGAQRLYTTADMQNKGEFKRPIVGLQAIEKKSSRRG
jgi:gluconate 2-dehydrogenase gamma chain